MSSKARWWEYVIVVGLMVGMALFVLAPTVEPSRTIVVPRGLSDTAFEREFDQALKDADQNDIISYNEKFDTPTPSALHSYFLNFSSISISDTADPVGDTPPNYDTATWSRNQVPHKLLIIEKYDTDGVLVDYTKQVEYNPNS